MQRKQEVAKSEKILTQSFGFEICVSCSCQFAQFVIVIWALLMAPSIEKSHRKFTVKKSLLRNMHISSRKKGDSNEKGMNEKITMQIDSIWMCLIFLTNC